MQTIRMVRPFCLFMVLVTTTSAQADDWPQWRGPKRDGVWREKGIVRTLPKTLKVVWNQKIGAGYAGPAVAGDRVFVTDRVLETGESNPSNPFDRRRVRGKERVLCLDVKTGKILWQHEYAAPYSVSYGTGPRATPTVDGDRVYALGAMGDLLCLGARDGKFLWSRNFVRNFGMEINTWGSSAAPLIDGRQLILLVGGKDGAGVVSLDKVTGAEIWRSLEVEDPGYCPPEIIESGGKKQLIIWHPRAINSLDPESGKLLWTKPFKVKSSLTIPSPIYSPKHRRLFVTAFYDGPMMLELSAGKAESRILWRGKSRSEIKTDGLHSIMCTPYFDGDYLYGVGSYGQLRCLEAATGKRIWETRQPTGKGRWWNAFLIRHEDRTFLSNEQGELIIAKLGPSGYEEQSRAFLIEPTNKAQRRKVVWSHPAFAHRKVFARNDREIICVDLGAE